MPNQTVMNMQQAFKLALSMTLLYWLALSLNWDLPKYGALAIALISLDTTGASLHKGIMRIVGTTVGLARGAARACVVCPGQLAYAWCTRLFTLSSLATSCSPADIRTLGL